MKWYADAWKKSALQNSFFSRHITSSQRTDTGYTLNYLLRALEARGPASLKTCVLVHKPERREVDVQMDYLGFEIPDVWVVGWGLDWAERYRTLPYIGVVKPPEDG